jgi:hypothetical protein
LFKVIYRGYSSFAINTGFIFIGLYWNQYFTSGEWKFNFLFLLYLKFSLFDLTMLKISFILCIGWIKKKIVF